MSRQRKAYQAYLTTFKRNHPDMVEPDCIKWKRKPIIEFLANATDLNRKDAKILTNLNGIYQHNDGRVAEIGATNSGQLPLAYVWPSMAAWQEYKQPMPFNVYHESW